MKFHVIIKENYDSGQFCSKQKYSTMKGRECCSVHVKGINEDLNTFDEYYCDNIINNDIYKDIYKKDIKEKKEFFEKVSDIKVDIDCPPNSNSIIIINLKILLLSLFLLI